jgi:hypothetical protein
MKKNVPQYVVGSLAVVVVASLFVWLMRNEGERTRQMIRDARRQSETSSQSASPQADKGRGRPTLAMLPE